MPRYQTDMEVLHNYGDPRPFLDSSGHIKPEWEGGLVEIALPAPLPLSWDRSKRVTTIRCHLKIASKLKAALDNIYNIGAWKYIRGYGGCYNFRAMRTNELKLSRHSWGIAIDLDCVNFIPPTWLQTVLKKFVKNVPPPPIIQIFAINGFVWGGDFHEADPMHFEIGV
jgi:hypothetical protein